MANLKEVRSRIASVISTQQITKAMKMVSASKLRRAQNAIQQMRPYETSLNAMLQNVLENYDGEMDSPFATERVIENPCLVVITSNRGLCGAFNTNILKAGVEIINSKYAKQATTNKLTIVCVGKKGNDFFKRRYPNVNVVSTFVDTFSDLSFDNVKKAAAFVMQNFEQKKFDHVSIVYGRFKNAAMQFAEGITYLPVTSPKALTATKKKKAVYIFEPTEPELLKELVPGVLQTTFYKCVLDTHASEHGARMTAMDKATENANELLKNLKINYNKARQEAITKELSEIVAGAAAQ